MPIDPISAAIMAGGSLLQGILGGIAKSQELKHQQKLLEQQRQWKQQDWQKVMDLLKPKTPLYEPQTIPALSYAVQKAIFGNLQERLGQDLLSRWGLNLEDILKTSRLGLPFSESPWGQQQLAIFPQKLTTPINNLPPTGRFPLLDYGIRRGRGLPEY